MCLQCDGWSAAEVERHINDLILQHGWTFQYVEDPNPRRRFGYTMGLTKLGEPEFLVRGLDMADTRRLFSGFVSAVIDRHEHFGNGHTANGPDGKRVYFYAMHGARRFALGAYARYGNATRVLELHFLAQDVPPATAGLVFKSVSIPAGHGPAAARKH